MSVQTVLRFPPVFRVLRVVPGVGVLLFDCEKRQHRFMTFGAMQRKGIHVRDTGKGGRAGA